LLTKHAGWLEERYFGFSTRPINKIAPVVRCLSTEQKWVIGAEDFRLGAANGHDGGQGHGDAGDGGGFGAGFVYRDECLVNDVIDAEFVGGGYAGEVGCSRVEGVGACPAWQEFH